MTAEQMARRTGPEHASAVRRLDGAREEQSRLATLFKAAVGTAAEPLARERLSAGRAYVAARQEWLHWIDEGESLAPWADGVWAPEAPRDEESRSMTAPEHLVRLRAEAAYRRQRLTLYRAKAYGSRPTTAVRLRELEREYELAASTLKRAAAANEPHEPRRGSGAPQLLS